MSPSAEPLPIGNGQSILIVDDETPILDITKETLEVYGYNVVAAENGRDAIDLYKQMQGTIEAVLVDSNMPDLNGRETVQELWKITPSLKVISVSGALEDAIPGARAFLTKPYSIANLLKLLQEVLAAA